MAYLLDTNIVSELRKGNRCETTVREWFDALDDDDAYLRVLVIGEIERGIERIRKRDPKSATRLRRWLSNLVTTFEDRILPVTLPIARTWGKMGAPNPIPTIGRASSPPQPTSTGSSSSPATSPTSSPSTSSG